MKLQLPEDRRRKRLLIAVIAALWVSRADAAVLQYVSDYWDRFLLWVQGIVT